LFSSSSYVGGSQPGVPGELHPGHTVASRDLHRPRPPRHPLILDGLFRRNALRRHTGNCACTFYLVFKEPAFPRPPDCLQYRRLGNLTSLPNHHNLVNNFRERRQLFSFVPDTPVELPKRALSAYRACRGRYRYRLLGVPGGTTWRRPERGLTLPAEGIPSVIFDKKSAPSFSGQLLTASGRVTRGSMNIRGRHSRCQPSFTLSLHYTRIPARKSQVTSTGRDLYTIYRQPHGVALYNAVPPASPPHGGCKSFSSAHRGALPGGCPKAFKRRVRRGRREPTSFDTVGTRRE
jgi:hypothetical protein